jgi:hypothetical protein
VGVRREKGMAITRYLTGHCGIVGLSWDGTCNQILSPSDYQIDVTTSRKLDNWHQLLRQETTNAHISIRYDLGMDSINQAWVGMQMSDFVPLLTAHYLTNQRGTE